MSIDEHRTYRWFFVALAGIASCIVFVGFAPTFYLGRLYQAPPLSTLLVIHGVAFSAWMVLLLTQTLLIRNAKLGVHRTLGLCGAALAATMLVLGVMVALEGAARGTLGVRFDLQPLDFLIVPLGQVVIFAVLVAAAIVLRHRPAAHKRLMIVATINLIAPAFPRAADELFNFGNPLAAMVGVSVLLAAGIVYDLVSRRRVHPVFAVIGPLTLLSFPLRIAFSHTAAWHAAAQWLTRFAPGV